MQQLIEYYKATLKAKIGQYHWVEPADRHLAILGVYNPGEMFAGSDRLSMSVMADNHKAKAVFEDGEYVVLAEGDRFTNSRFIEIFEPFIIRIKGDGAAGRAQRGSTQTDRQIKSIQTRVMNIMPDFVAPNSEAAAAFLKLEIEAPSHVRRSSVTPPKLF